MSVKDLDYETYRARYEELQAAIRIAVRNNTGEFNQLWKELEELQERRWRLTKPYNKWIDLEER